MQRFTTDDMIKLLTCASTDGSLLLTERERMAIAARLRELRRESLDKLIADSRVEELQALRDAGLALRDDMLMRARIRAEFEGREVPTVDASDGLWMKFCDALEREEVAPSSQPGAQSPATDPGGDPCSKP